MSTRAEPPTSAARSWSRRLTAAALAAGLAAFLALPIPAQETPAAGGTTDTYRLRGASVAVHNVAGRVEVVRGEGEAMRVEVARRGDDADRLSVATGVLDGIQTLRVLYPEDRVVYPDREERDLPDFLGWLGIDVQSEFEVGEDGRVGDGDREVQVVSSGNGLRAWADLRIHVPAGQRVAVHAGVGSVKIRNVDGPTAVELASGPVDAEGVHGSLSLDTGSGSVRVASATGDLDVDTGSGDVRLQGVSGSRVRVGTGSGSVEGRGIGAEDLEVDTGSGGIDLREVSARNLLLDTGSGGVDLELASDLERGEIDTGSGGVTVAVPSDFGARLELDTGSGSIDVELAARDVSRDDDRYSGVVGDGEGTLVVDTGSGGIRVRRR